MKTLPIKALEKTFNRYLALDPDSQILMTPLEGHVLGLHIQRPKLSLYFSFVENKVALSTEPPEQVNTDIYASLFQLIRLKFNKNSSLMTTQFYIKGDVDTAQRFHALLEKHQIDWEEHLSTIIGDVGAHNLIQLLKKPSALLKRNKEKLAQDLVEYSQEEKQWLPSHQEMLIFRQDVDALRLQIDRLEAKIHIAKHEK